LSLSPPLLERPGWLIFSLRRGTAYFWGEKEIFIASARAVLAFNAYQTGNEEATVMMEEFSKYFHRFGSGCPVFQAGEE
jgi:hypothetical protein